MQITSDERQADERLLVVNEADEVIGETTRALHHANRLLVRLSYVLVINAQGHTLLQKRSHEKAFDPNSWTTSVSGHVVKHQTYLDAALQEMDEELGIAPQNLQFIGKTLMASNQADASCSGVCGVFVLQADIPLDSIQTQADEVVDVAYFDPALIKQALDGEHPLLRNGEEIRFASDFPPVFLLYWEARQNGALNQPSAPPKPA